MIDLGEPFQLRIEYNPNNFHFLIDDINDPDPAIVFTLGTTEEQVFSRLVVEGKFDNIPFIGFADIGKLFVCSNGPAIRFVVV